MSDKDKFKFSSSYLNKPFTPNYKNDNNQIDNDELIQENLEIENETPSKNKSKLNNYDITYSISEQRPQTSGFNESNINNFQNNLAISTTSFNSKKRKPFENLTFYSEKKNNIYNESNINENNNNSNSNSNNISNINKDKEKEDIDSEMSEIEFKNINPLKESKTELNVSTISENEKSMIMSSYKLVSKETIEKAKKFNKQYKTTPFWIKFFEDLENNSLKNNSSYFKINNKNEYVKNLVDMIQRDADIYDKIQKSKEIKNATENEIKKIIEENNNINNNNETNNESNVKNNESKISIDSNKKNIKNNTNINNNSKTLKKNELEKNSKNNNETEKKNDINNKFNQILETYNKLNEKEQKIYNNEEDYETFKFKLITGGKFNTDKEKEIEKIPKKIKKLEKLEDISEKQMNEKEKQKEEILKYKGLKEFKTIDALYFGDNYTFEELNYDKIDFFAYNKESLPKLLALDKRLHEIDPERYKTSINTELKRIQDEFNIGKEERMKRADKEIRDQFNKQLKETKETKKTIFDVKPNDETKIKYKDYLHSNDEIKKERKELKMKLNKLDDKIKKIYSNKEISKEQINIINKEIEDYHLTEEYKQKYENLNVPGLVLLNNLKKEIINFENTNKEISEGLLEAKKLLELEKKRASKEEVEKYLKEIVQPFYEHEKEVENFEKENKNDFDKVIKLEESIKKEEELLNNIQNSLNNLNENKNKYEEMFEEADKIIMENNKQKNKNEENEGVENNEEGIKEIEETREYNPDEIIKKYGVDEIIQEQKENEKLINDFNSQMKLFEEKIKNIKNLNDESDKIIEEKKFMTPEEFCQIPDEVKEYLKEKEKELNNNHNLENDINLEEENNKEIKEKPQEKDKKILFKENINDEVEKEPNINNDNIEEIIKDSLEINKNVIQGETNNNKNLIDSLEINNIEIEDKIEKK